MGSFLTHIIPLRITSRDQPRDLTFLRLTLFRFSKIFHSFINTEVKRTSSFKQTVKVWRQATRDARLPSKTSKTVFKA